MVRSNRTKSGGGYANIQRYYDPNYPLYPEATVPSTFISAGSNPAPDATRHNLYPYNAYTGACDNRVLGQHFATGPTATTTINPGAKGCAPCAGGAKKSTRTRRQRGGSRMLTLRSRV